MIKSLILEEFLKSSAFKTTQRAAARSAFDELQRIDDPTPANVEHFVMLERAVRVPAHVIDGMLAEGIALEEAAE